MNLSFKNKVALVTGAGSGMGLATARAFAEAGAAVALADVDEDTVRSAAEELAAAGHKAIAVRCNVADEAEVAAMVEQTVSTFGRLDAAFNNAGVQSLAVETADATGEEFDRVNAINLRGAWNCMKYELRQMREQGSGAIVNCSSIGGLIGIPGRAAYHASKHGVIGLTPMKGVKRALEDSCRLHENGSWGMAGFSDIGYGLYRALLEAGFDGWSLERFPFEGLGLQVCFSHGGPAPVRRFLPELIDLVWNGKINPGKVFDLTLPLDQVAEGYRAMDERRAIKTLLRP